MGKLHWSPWMTLELGRSQERLVAKTTGTGEEAYAWQPAADMVETAHDYRITVELPGFGRDEVTVEARGRFLLVQGERFFNKDADEVFQVLERSYGPFSRRFELPKDVSRAGITAVMKDGLLLIILPKARPECLRRRICIS